MAEEDDIFEVLNLDDLLSDDENSFDFQQLLESDEDEEYEEQVVRVQEPNLDPFQFLHLTYYSFKRELANYFVEWTKGRVVPSANTIITLDPNFVRQEDSPVEAWHKAILKKWALYGRNFGVRVIANGEERLFNRKFPHLNVPYIDEWPSIVEFAHRGGESHLTYKDTTLQIGNAGWLVGAQMNGIPKPFIEKVINSCSRCHLGEQREERGVRRYRQYPERYSMPLAELEGFMNNLMAQNSVLLKPIHRYRRVTPYPHEMVIYICHRGRKFQGKTCEDDSDGNRVRQCSTAKYVGCKFCVRVLYLVEEGQDLEVHVNAEHRGHEPGSKTDSYFLPIHQSAVDNCAEMLRNLNNIQFALVHSKRCEEILRQAAPLHEQKTFRFFLDPKEASNLSYKLQSQERGGGDDYDKVKETVPKWIEKKKVIFYQAYDPLNPDPDKRPFVLVMQTEEMLQRAKTITPNSAWVIDSTFKTNQWGMPLFAGVCPNASGLGMPIFIMLCSDDNESGQVGTALWLTMKAVFRNMDGIRPNAIVIDKDKTSRTAITKAINEDVWCWQNQEIGGIQTKCQLLLCWFHAKKAWVEHLLPKLPEAQRNDLYKDMSAMLEAITEDGFNKAYGRFKTKYANHIGVLKYVEKGWAGDNSPWKRMWPRWARMFRHGHANTTNLVERMWQYVKYTLLDGKVNRRLDELIYAIIGDPDNGRRFEGMTLDEHYNDAH